MFLDKYLHIDKASNPDAKAQRIALTAVEIFALYKGYGLIKSIGRDAINKQINKDINNPAYNIPGAQYTIPGASPVQTTPLNVAQAASALEFNYNPGGWTTDRQGLLNTLSTIPPQNFRQVEAYYNSTYSRNLMNDLNSAFSGVWQAGWNAYKSQIV